jgi:hypothetical protein
MNGTIFGKKGIGHKMCYDFLYNFYRKYLSFYEEFKDILSQMYMCRQVNLKFEFSQHTFEKY